MNHFAMSVLMKHFPALVLIDVRLIFVSLVIRDE
jgi:hypothetical protein